MAEPAETRIAMVMRARAMVMGGCALWLEAMAAELPERDFGRRQLERAVRNLHMAAREPAVGIPEIALAMRQAIDFYGEISIPLGEADCDPPEWVRLFRAALNAVDA